MVRPDSRIWFPIASSISTGSVVGLAYWRGYDAKSPWIAVYAGVVGAVFFWVFEYLTTKVMEFQGARLSIDGKRARFEGEWLEFYKDEEVDAASGNRRSVIKYGYFRIRYTGKTGEPYLLKGNAYDSSGHNYARWASKVIKFDGNKGIIDYFYFGYFFQRDFSVRGMANLSFDDRTSYAVLPSKAAAEGGRGARGLRLLRPQSTTFNSGTGYFLDSSAAGTQQTKFHFVKVTDELVELVMGSKRVHDLDAERAFITTFHARYAEGIMRNDYLVLGE